MIIKDIEETSNYISSVKNQFINYAKSIGFDVIFFDGDGVVYIDGVALKCTIGKTYLFIDNSNWFNNPIKTQIKYNTHLNNRKYKSKLEWIYKTTLLKQKISVDFDNRSRYLNILSSVIQSIEHWGGISGYEIIDGGALIFISTGEYSVELLLKYPSMLYEIYITEIFGTIFNNPLKSSNDFKLIYGSIKKLEKSIFLIYSAICYKIKDHEDNISEHTLLLEE